MIFTRLNVIKNIERAKIISFLFFCLISIISLRKEMLNFIETEDEDFSSSNVTFLPYFRIFSIIFFCQCRKVAIDFQLRSTLVQ